MLFDTLARRLGLFEGTDEFLRGAGSVVPGATVIAELITRVESAEAGVASAAKAGPLRITANPDNTSMEFITWVIGFPIIEIDYLLG